MGEPRRPKRRRLCFGFVTTVVLTVFQFRGWEKTYAPSPLVGVVDNEAPHSNVTMDSITCELPGCDLVVQSRVHSERCGDDPLSVGWPLLITSTPRSATVFAQSSLVRLGMWIQDDWHRHRRDGRVSWMFAFDDVETYGGVTRRAVTTDDLKFRRVLHHVKEPLSSITSMCTEPFSKPAYVHFLWRHIPLNSSRADGGIHKGRVCLEFWVQWHTFLVDMKFPTYRIEDVEFQSIFEVSGLSHLYNHDVQNSSTSNTTNSRKHRSTFTWQDLYTMDPLLAAEAWILAHRFGYSYPSVDFDNLTCLEAMPRCAGKDTSVPSDKCPPSTHPHPTNMSDMMLLPSLDPDVGFAGWVDSGCVEHKIGWSGNGTYVGIRGLLGRDDLEQVEAKMDPILFEELNKTAVTKRWRGGHS